MEESLQISGEVIIAFIVGALIVFLGGICSFFYWKGGLDQWRKNIDKWEGDTGNKLEKLKDKINKDFKEHEKILNDLSNDMKLIKSNLEKEATKNGMVRKFSPLFPSKEAIDVLKEVSILSQINRNISYIKSEVNIRSRLTIYKDIKDKEELFVDIAPSIIHKLIEEEKIDEKKINKAMNKLEKDFDPNVASYYGVLLLITAYILEEMREKDFAIKPSRVYERIDTIASKSLNDLLVRFNGDTKKAIENFKKNIASMKELGEKEELIRNKNNLGLIYRYIGKYEKAEKEYREAIEFNPKDKILHNNLGLLLSDLERYEEAEEELRKAIELNPDYVDAYSNLAFIFRKSKRYEEAEEELRKAIELDPKEGGLRFNLGLLLSDLERYEEAEEELRKAIELDPDYVDAHNNLGALLYDLERYEEAEEEYRKAIELDPKDGELRFNLGFLLSDLERYEEAEKEFRRTIELDPNYVDAYNNLAFILRKSKRYEEAEKELRKAIELDPKEGGLRFNLGLLLSDLERYEEVEEEYRKAIELDPNYVDVYNNLAFILRKSKRYEEAEEEYRKAIELDPNYVDAHNNLGALLYVLERYEEAEEEYKKAIEINPTYVSPRINLIELYIAIKNYEKVFGIEKDLIKLAKEKRHIIIIDFLKIYLYALQNKKKEMNSEIRNLLEILKEAREWKLDYDFSQIKKLIKDLDKSKRLLISSLLDLLENKITLEDFRRIR